MVDQLHFMDIAWTRQGCFLVPKPSSAAIGAVFPDWQTLILSVFSSHFMSMLSHFKSPINRQRILLNSSCQNYHSKLTSTDVKSS